MSTFEDREKKVLSFMEAVQEQREIKEEEDNFINSTEYKLKTLDKCEKDAKEICLDKIFSKIYKDAIPLNDDYKNAYADDLDDAYKSFMASRCPKGIEFYVREGIKRNSPFARKVLEAVNDLVEDQYRQKALNIEDYDAKDLIFSTNDDVQLKLDVVGQSLSGPEISQAVKDNVKQSALSEITRAKQEKENIKNIESELAKDININTQEAVEEALELRGYGQPKDYVPTLFEGIMINKLNMIQPKYESGQMQEVYTYNALSDYGYETTEGAFATPEELAFIESVKEYTGLNMLKALKLEQFTKYRIDDLAQEYAQQRFNN